MTRRLSFPLLVLHLGGLVAGASACGPDTSACSSAAVAPEKEVELSAEAACAVAKRPLGVDQLSYADCQSVCGAPYSQCRLDADYAADFRARNPDGGASAPPEDGGVLPQGRCPTRTAKVTCRDDLGCIGGRATAGLAAPRVVGAVTAAAHLSASAELEAISVVAFERLAFDLTCLGAPEALALAARAAADDERRHAATLGALAARAGGAGVGAPPPPPFAPRSLVAIARENAREGCVRETYGALVCAFAAHRAADPELRAAMRGIAEDEARHAALSWDLHEWALGELSRDEAAEVLAELAAARAELARTVLNAAAGPREIGLPSRREAARLLAGMGRLELAA